MAKFKVGDKVKVVGKGLASKGWVGKVVKVDTSNKGWPYKVHFDGRDDGEYAEAEIVSANAAPTQGFSFKVGDKAMLVWDKPGAGEIVKLTGKTPAGLFKFKMDDGGEGQAEEKDLVPASMHNSAPVSANSVVRNAMATNARVAKNADEDINMKLGRATDRLASTISGNLKKLSEDYAYWIERNCGTEVKYLLEIAQENENVQPSIIAEIKRQRKRIDDAIAASKRLPR